MKRARKYPNMCPNPLFEKWLDEWKQEAILRDTPVQHSFNKALASLKMFPLTLERGKDCHILKSFGPKLCEMLDKKLDEQIKINNLPPNSGQSAVFLKEKDDGKKRKKADVTPNDDEDQPDLPQEAKKRKKAAPKPYVPKVGSGAYALLITMFMKSQEPGYPGYMLRKDLISDAQEYCDSPMKGTATEHYSGWSSMTTLIKKNYVIKVSNPAKYSLTDSGVALAFSLHESKSRDDEAGPSSNNSGNPCNTANIASTGKNNRDFAVASSSKSSDDDFINHVPPKAPTDFHNMSDLSDDDNDDVNYNDFFHSTTLPKTNNSTGRSSTTATRKQFNPDDYGPALTDAELDEFLKENIQPQTNTFDYGTSVPSKGGSNFENTSPLKSSQEKPFEYFDGDAARNPLVDLDDFTHYSPPPKDTKEDCKVVDDVIVLDDDDEEDFRIRPKIDDHHTDEPFNEPRRENGQSNSKSSYLDPIFDESPNEKIDQEKSFQNTSIEEDKSTGSPVPSTSSSIGIKGSLEKTVDVVIIDDDDEDDFLKNEGIHLQSNFLDRVKESCRLESSSSCGSEEEFQRFCHENEEPIITVRKRPNPIVTDLLKPPMLSDEIEEIKDNFVEDQESISSSTSHMDDMKKHRDQDVGNLVSLSRGKEDATEKIQKDQLQEIEYLTPQSQERGTIVDTNKTKKREQKETKDPVPASQGKKAVEEDSTVESFILLPTNFDIILLVDTQETSGSKTKPKDDQTISELTKNKVLFEVRSLKVGDFTWIARCRFTNKELILPYIIERKRTDDLASSIMDGRYNEQKFRLRKSGLSNVIYLIENYGRTYHGALPITSLMQAAVNSTVQDDFVVKFTRDHRDSMKYLSILTSMLIKKYQNKELRSCSKKDLESPDPNLDENTERLLVFSDFNKAAVKTRKYNVREMFIRQLIQLKGISVDKASAIVELYPTPKLLAAACDKGDEKLIAEIKAGPSKRKIGPAISKTIYQFYTKRNFS
ncbi:hypothetical protein QAD02_009096 [Eretmocerus hayati]|uniref:Uncharacterized protein n=1 Tax=Eretmocerus hayati TaxID=131215 RepID=A0ACC2N8J9_9HYME|nr:hypothetical protein QAD02_009096 [Eretmocerus hayati]